MNYPTLSPRLAKIADLIPNCSCVADIGTDHGYVPIFSVLSEKSSRAIASDINPGPINRAFKNVEAFGMQDKISLRLGGGLSAISPGEADVIVIAGMGGMLISNILAASMEVVKNAKLLIFQPMTAQTELRDFLCQNHIMPKNEYLASEDDKIYNIITAACGDGIPYSKEELVLGRGLKETSPTLYDRHRSLIIDKLEKRAKGLKASTAPENHIKAMEIEELLKNL